MANSKFGSWNKNMERREGKGRRKWRGGVWKFLLGSFLSLILPSLSRKLTLKTIPSLSCMCNRSFLIGPFQLSFTLAPSLIFISWDPYCISEPCWAADENFGINSWEGGELTAVEEERGWTCHGESIYFILTRSFVWSYPVEIAEFGWFFLLLFLNKQ